MAAATDLTLQDGATPDDAARSEKAPSELVLVSHSSLIYWWPVWVVSLALGAYTSFTGQEVFIDADGAERVVESNGPGLVFVFVTLAVILFTNVAMRGLASVVAILAGALTIVSLAYFGVWDDIVRRIPELSVHMNAGFFWVFGGVLAVLWTLQFFLFDRLVQYRIRPGQMVEERLISGGERSFDTTGMLFEQQNDDFFRHRLLGLGTGDLKLLTADARAATIVIRNVLRAERRVDEIQHLIKVRPDTV